MVPESTLSLAGDDFKFDIDFEFDAPRFYDFSRPELYSETEEIEFWFQSSGNYPPSPFSPKFNWKFEPFEQVTSTISESKPVEVSIESLDPGLNRKDKFNGFIYYNQKVRDVSKTKSKSKTKLSISTLTRPTASLLARQNKPLDIYSVQLLTRCQRSLAKFGGNISPILVSKLQNQNTKRQNMEAKVANVSRRSKLTVPKEPNLRTAERSERHKSKVNSETEQNAKSSSSSSKRHTRNKFISLEPSSTSLPKTNTPRSQDLQVFRLRTSLRAKERSSNAKTDAMQENDATNSRTLKRTDSSKSRIAKENHCRKINCQVYESKTCPLNPKRSSREELGEAVRIEYGNQSSCRTGINRSLDLCRQFDSQEVARSLITA